MGNYKIGTLELRIPIIQGGMGVGVSLSSLASAVAREGGIGIISAAQVGYKEDDFFSNPKEANIRALKKEIIKAKQKANGGIIGVNIMVAQNYYEELVKATIEAGADVIISGAGLPIDLPKLTKGSKIKIAPIVSSVKATKIITTTWKKRYNYIPDFIVVEGPNAGGHLGFHMECVKDGNVENLEEIVRDILEFVDNKISVVAAGGIYTREDIKKYLDLGASAVQMATRFICTEECDADIKFKTAFLNCKKDDIKIIKSPVGMPGRAIKNKFIESIEKGRKPVSKCYRCLNPKKCNPSTTIFCITKALINAVNGDVDNGLIFTGSNGYKIDKIVSVKELIKELTLEQ